MGTGAVNICYFRYELLTAVQNLYTIKTSRASEVDDLLASPLVEELLAVDSCCQWETHSFLFVWHMVMGRFPMMYWVAVQT